jgi:hypothetical protein
MSNYVTVRHRRTRDILRGRQVGVSEHLILCDSVTKPIGMALPLSWIVATSGCGLLSFGTNEFHRDFEVVE